MEVEVLYKRLQIELNDVVQSIASCSSENTKRTLNHFVFPSNFAELKINIDHYFIFGYLC